MVGIIKFERLWGIRKTTVVKFIETLGDHSARMRREIKKIDKRKWFGKKKKEKSQQMCYDFLQRNKKEI